MERNIEKINTNSATYALCFTALKRYLRSAIVKKRFTGIILQYDKPSAQRTAAAVCTRTNLSRCYHY
jgi:hypothetical protein